MTCKGDAHEGTGEAREAAWRARLSEKVKVQVLSVHCRHLCSTAARLPKKSRPPWMHLGYRSRMHHRGLHVLLLFGRGLGIVLGVFPGRSVAEATARSLIFTNKWNMIENITRQHYTVGHDIFPR